MCRHLAASLNDGPRNLGFFTPDGHDDEPNAWCAACDAELQREGAWNDKSEGFAGVTLICRNCFDVARETNERLGETS